MSEKYAELRKLAVHTALEAGALLKAKWGGSLEIRSKGYRDLVTDADLAAQALITRNILSHFPDHGFITEEDAPGLATDGDLLWIIDPLDGTTNYSRNHPIFCTSIGVAEKLERDA